MSSPELLKLADLLARPLESIEILPGCAEDWFEQGARSDFPFVLVEGNLGVPKKVLYKIYLTAVATCKFNLVDDEDQNIVIASTSVVLLGNPAHQTALNMRKRLVMKGMLSPEREVVFTDLLLRGTSECAKESAMWDHRRWIFRRLYGTSAYIPLEHLQSLHGWFGPVEWKMIPNISATIVRRELGLSRRCCEIYPRNYYGWNHWRYMMNIAYVRLHEGLEWQELVEEEFREMLKWVEGHVSDYTAMHHLTALVERFGMNKEVLVRQVAELRAFWSSQHEALEKYAKLLGVDKIR